MRLALALAFVSCLVVSVARADEIQTTVQTIVFTSGVSGHFADPRCVDGTDFAPSAFAPYANALRQATASPSAFAFDTGGLFEPHGVGRFAMQTEPSALARLADALGYDVLAFAAKDLQAPREPLVRLGHALATVGLPFVASNLRCEASASTLCDVVDDASEPVRIVESGGERVAFVALIDPAIFSHVAAENRVGLSLEPLLPAFHRAVTQARADGATLIVASVDNGAGVRASGDAIALAESLPEEDRPDLLVAARAGRELLYARPAAFQPPIAAAPPGRAATVEVRRRGDAVRLEMLVQPLAPSDTADPGLDAFVAQQGPRYCAALGTPMAGAHLASELGADGLWSLAGGAMRVATDAEVAFLNRPMIDEHFARAAGHTLTASDVYLGVQFDDPLVVAEVEASWLQAAARRIATRSDIRAVGLTIDNPGAANEVIKVNGRVLETQGRYRVVVSRFLASGGDEALPEGPRFEPVGELSVRDSLLSWLRSPRDGDPRAALPDPADSLEWNFAITSDTSLGNSSIHNRGNYADTQFDRATNLSYGTQNQVDLLARSTRVSWENQLMLRYRTTASRGLPRQESDDLASFRSTFAWRQPRVRHPVAYVPEPYAESYLETEFSVPGSRQHRHFLVRPTVGARFTLAPPLSLKVQAGGSFEIYDPAVAPSPGVGTVLTLTSWKFFDTGRRRGTLEGTFDWFLSGLGVAPTNTLRGNVALGLQLNHVLGLSFTSTLFAVKQPGSDFSYVVNTTANLRLAFFVRTQR